MFAKVYQYKFGTVAEAKVAASFCSDNLGKKISQYKFQSLNVMIGKDGDLSIFIKFDTIDRLKKYETESDAFIKELKQTFVFPWPPTQRHSKSFKTSYLNSIIIVPTLVL